MFAPARVAEPLVRVKVLAAPAIKPPALSLNLPAALFTVMDEPFSVPVRFKVPAPVKLVAPV